MERASNHSRHFVQQLAGLSDRLATHNLVVARLHCDWSTFGSWQLDVQRGVEADRYALALARGELDVAGPAVARALWDGREQTLKISVAPTPPLAAPRSWETCVTEALDSFEASVRYTEEYLTKWSTSSAS